MSYLKGKSTYDKNPKTMVTGFDDEAFEGWDQIKSQIASETCDKQVVVVDCYLGVYDEELLENFKEAICPDVVINMDDIFVDGDEMTRRMQRNLTDDRVRGIMYYGSADDFIDTDKLLEAQKLVETTDKKVLIYGFCASKVAKGDLLIYADMTRWEIQLRYRKGMPNYKQTNYDEDILRKYKRGYFVEWRIADRHKAELYDSIDYFLDTTVENEPKMVSGEGFREGLKTVLSGPFRLKPYFDAGVWGGHWMQDVFDLPEGNPNYAWSYDGVPEELSINMQYGDVCISSPAMNLTKYLPKEFLGKKTYARYGAEFPIRFDLLDTMGGQNLSLQVHPLTDYMKTNFGMPYTQDESYYILDAGKGAGVYLGLKEDIDSQQMIEDLYDAERGNQVFDDEKYVNRFPAKKHDHFLIPAGTIHCSSSDCMVLEISATPYIFTFKLWDWGRLGLDGKPRPIHIDHGKHNIDFTRDTKWVQDNLVNQFNIVKRDGLNVEKVTGLHELEPIETRIFDVVDQIDVETNDEVAQLNLVGGKEVKIESVEGRFEPFTVHYAESAVIPASVGKVRFSVDRSCDPVKVLVAQVRF